MMLLHRRRGGRRGHGRGRRPGAVRDDPKVPARRRVAAPAPLALSPRRWRDVAGAPDRVGDASDNEVCAGLRKVCEALAPRLVVDAEGGLSLAKSEDPDKAETRCGKPLERVASTPRPHPPALSEGTANQSARAFWPDVPRADPRIE